MAHLFRFLYQFRPNPLWTDALRAGISLTLLVDMLMLRDDFAVLYGSDRFVDAPLLALKQDFPVITVGPVSQYAVWVTYLACCLLVLFNYRPRIALIVLLLLHQLLFTGHTLFAYGFDYLAASALWYAVLAPTTRRNVWHAPLLRVLQLHLCAIYLVSGINKAFGAGWWDGSALWKAVMQPGYPVGIPVSVFGQLPSSCWMVGGWLVILLEIVYPIFIWRSATRRFVLWGMVALHIGIALLMGLYLFSLVMITLNLAAFHYPYLPFSKQLLPSISFMVKPLRKPANGRETPAGADEADTKHPEHA